MEDIETTQATTEEAADVDAGRTTAAETQIETTQGMDQQDVGETGKGDAAPEVDVGKLIRDNKHLTGLVKQFQARLYGDADNEAVTKRATAPDEREREAATAQESAVDELEDDLDVDAQSGWVTYKGTSISPEFAKHLGNQAKAIDDLREETHRAQIESLVNDMASAIEDQLVEAREQRFPFLDKQRAQIADDLLNKIVDSGLTRAKEEGQRLSTDLIQSVINDSLVAVAELIGSAGAAQAESNKQYAEKNPVKPGGQAAVQVAKGFHLMSKSEQMEAATRAAKRMLDRTSSG